MKKSNNNNLENDVKEVSSAIAEQSKVLTKDQAKKILLCDNPEEAFKLFNEFLDRAYKIAESFGFKDETKAKFDAKVESFKEKHGKIYRVTAILGSIVKKICSLILKAVKITVRIVSNIAVLAARITIDTVYSVSKEVSGALAPLSLENQKDKLVSSLKDAFEGDDDVIITAK